MCINCEEVLEQVSDLENCLAASAKGGYAHFCLVHMWGARSRNHAQGTHVNTKLTVAAALSVTAPSWKPSSGHQMPSSEKGGSGCGTPTP